MPTTTHQTVHLSEGKHAGPDDGACVMELASMLAGEEFTDRPRSVCPVIAGFLRAYNDGVDDERRQDLCRFASAAVGTRGSASVQADRASRCREWALAQRWQLRRGLRRRVMPPSITVYEASAEEEAGAIAGRIAAKSVARNCPGAHDRALGFVERLIVYGEPSSAWADRYTAAWGDANGSATGSRSGSSRILALG